MLVDDLLEAGVQLLAELVQHHGVGVAVELLEAQAAVVLLLDLLNGALQHLPYVLHILDVDCRLVASTHTHKTNAGAK